MIVAYGSRGVVSETYDRWQDNAKHECFRKEVTMQPDIWTSREAVTPLGDAMVGYDVEGRDGKIGSVNRVTYERTCLIVSTSRLFGKKYVIPANAVESVDAENETIFVDLSKEEVESSPEYDDDLGFDEDCEARTGVYYNDVFARRTSPQ